MNHAQAPIRIGIIGGGPGGLMTADLLQKRLRVPHQLFIIEATSRLGGKIQTRCFGTAGVAYEAGAAEFYDYSETGPDPLRDLILELGLNTHPLSGRGVVVRGQLLHSDHDILRQLGRPASDALEAFGRRARSLISAADYYTSDWREDNEDPLGRIKWSDLLAEVPDESAREYLRYSTHSDLATEPHQTSALYGLHNYLMNEPGYMRLYGIDGGNERLTQALAERSTATVLLGHRVVEIAKAPGRGYRVIAQHEGAPWQRDFDYVIVALPHNHLSSVRWGGQTLAKAMNRHQAHYNHPGHYLRVSLLFRRPFWRSKMAGSYLMLDAFDGCCVYDETSRHGSTEYGVLGWLLAGEAALRMSSLGDEEIIGRVFASLPPFFGGSHDLLLEGSVNRWIGSVSGLPGGYPLKDPVASHRPEPSEHPGLLVVGDYLFDATLNGVLDSADVACDLILKSPLPQDAALFAGTGR